jgi:L-lactate dehydrogenase complex protein LldG
MDESTTREKVLKKIRAALLSKSQNPFPKLDFESPVFVPSDEDILVLFNDKLTAAGGKFFLIENELEFVEGMVDLGVYYKWKNIVCTEDGLSNLLTECELPHSVETIDLGTSDVSITTCEFLIAQTGSILVSTRNQSRAATLFAPVHIVLARASQLTLDLKEALLKFRQTYPKLPSALSIITGPSHTADIEGRLVTGAHGPQQLYCFVIDDRELY